MTTTAEKVTTSVDLIPNSKLLNDVANRAAINDRTNPTATPIPVSCSPDFSTIVTTCEREAPSVIRTPISCVRCATAYAITPYRPTPVNSNARPAKASSNIALNGCVATEDARYSSIVLMSYTGRSGSKDETTLRTADAMLC